MGSLKEKKFIFWLVITVSVFCIACLFCSYYYYVDYHYYGYASAWNKTSSLRHLKNALYKDGGAGRDRKSNSSNLIQAHYIDLFPEMDDECEESLGEEGIDFSTYTRDEYDRAREHVTI